MFRVEPGGNRLDHAELRNNKVVLAVFFGVQNPSLVGLFVPQSNSPTCCPKVHPQVVSHIGLVFFNQAGKHVRGCMRVCTIEKLLALVSVPCDEHIPVSKRCILQERAEVSRKIS